jgi:hypothetical protein
MKAENQACGGRHGCVERALSCLLLLLVIAVFSSDHHPSNKPGLDLKFRVRPRRAIDNLTRIWQPIPPLPGPPAQASAETNQIGGSHALRNASTTQGGGNDGACTDAMRQSSHHAPQCVDGDACVGHHCTLFFYWCTVLSVFTTNQPTCVRWPREPTPRWPLLVSGMPRSGTVQTATVLNALGMEVNDDWHTPKKHGLVSWIHVFRDPTDTWFGPVRLRGGEFGAIVLQTRHILDAFNSLLLHHPDAIDNVNGIGKFSDFGGFLCRHMDCTGPCWCTGGTCAGIDPKATSMSCRRYRTLDFWVQWIRHTRSVSSHHYKIEDLMSANNASVTIIRRLFETAHLRQPEPGSILATIEKITAAGKGQNSRKAKTDPAKPTWLDIIDIDTSLGCAALKISIELGYPADAAATARCCVSCAAQLTAVS